MIFLYALHFRIIVSESDFLIEKTFTFPASSFDSAFLRVWPSIDGYCASLRDSFPNDEFIVDSLTLEVSHE